MADFSLSKCGSENILTRVSADNFILKVWSLSTGRVDGGEKWEQLTGCSWKKRRASVSVFSSGLFPTGAVD